jgi:hypothetical protein
VAVAPRPFGEAGADPGLARDGEAEPVGTSETRMPSLPRLHLNLGPFFFLDLTPDEALG